MAPSAPTIPYRRDSSAFSQSSYRRYSLSPPEAATTARIADLYDQAARAETRLAEVRQLIENRESEQFDEGILASAFADFDATWNALSPREQAQALQLLVDRVEYDVAEIAKRLAATEQRAAAKPPAPQE